MFELHVIHHLHGDDDRALLHQILAKVTHMAETLDSLKAKVEEVRVVTNNLATVVNDVVVADAAEDAAFQKEIDDLKAQLASGVPISQADLDALGQDLTGQSATLTSLSEALKAIGTATPIPPVVPVTPV